MRINHAIFVKSSASLKELPPADLPEYAFVGRSNVGKSSLINALCDRKSLARTSSSPGKTQLINHFLVDDSWYLVDLPGYGYAKVSKKQRSGFQQLILDYVSQRANLDCLFVLVDSRLKPQEIDMEFIEFLGVNKVPFAIVFTKTDKPGQKQFQQNLKAFKGRMAEQWEELPSLFFTSSVKSRGMHELLSFIEEVNQSIG